MSVSVPQLTTLIACFVLKLGFFNFLNTNSPYYITVLPPKFTLSVWLKEIKAGKSPLFFRFCFL